MNKKVLSETDICSKFITPAVTAAGWDEMSQVRREVFFTKGRIIVRGKLVTRGKAERADYILYYKPNIPIALIEAKTNTHAVGAGMQQALTPRLSTSPSFSPRTARPFLFHDRTGQSGQMERDLAAGGPGSSRRPAPSYLWMLSRRRPNSGPLTAHGRGWLPNRRRPFARTTMRTLVGKEPRYYQQIAINRTLLSAYDGWEVPSNWERCGLADLVLFIDDRGQAPSKTEQGIRLITAKNVRRSFISAPPRGFMPESSRHAWLTRGVLKVGDVLFTTEAPMGHAADAYLPEGFALAQRVCFSSYGSLDSTFLTLLLFAEPVHAVLTKMITGLAAKGIKTAKLLRLPVAVPLLVKQHRIAAKVNKLRVLCDQLEAQLNAA